VEQVDARKRREDPRKKKARDMAKKYRRARHQSEDTGVDWSSDRHKVRQILNQFDGVTAEDAIKLGKTVKVTYAENKDNEESKNVNQNEENV